jgi:hypothetical protein|tara:strand:- start:963 stop:1274 length:312 start_codon:yes stop_codon:yes gene_type:complete
MRKTDTVRILNFAVDDLKKIIDFFEEKGEEIHAIDIKTPEAMPYLDVGKGCCIDTEINETDFNTFRTYELLNNFYGEITIENFRLLTERTTWNYDIIEDIEEV